MLVLFINIRHVVFLYYEGMYGFDYTFLMEDFFMRSYTLEDKPVQGKHTDQMIKTDTEEDGLRFVSHVFNATMRTISNSTKSTEKASNEYSNKGL